MLNLELGDSEISRNSVDNALYILEVDHNVKQPDWTHAMNGGTERMVILSRTTSTSSILETPEKQTSNQSSRKLSAYAFFTCHAWTL